VDRLLALDDERAGDPRVTGAKAAALALARRAGLPVLPGWVVPVPAGAAAWRASTRVLVRSGAPAARLATADRRLGAALEREVEVVARLAGEAAIVRSSTVQEADPRWAGAFATYHEVVGADLPTAIRGCWASALSRDVLARCDAMGIDPGEIRMAVLIQPWIAFDGGGTAVVAKDGSVRVTAVTGPPSALVGGRAGGVFAAVGVDEDVAGDRDLGGLGTAVLLGAAELARATLRTTGNGVIEWGAARGDVVLLQARPSPVPASPGAAPSFPPRRSLPLVAERIARLATRYPSPLGDRLVIPWALSLAEIPRLPAAEVADPVEALRLADALACELTGRAWGLPAEAAPAAAAEVMRSILGPDPEPGFARVAELRPVDPAAAARVVALVEGIGDALVARGVLDRRELVWRLSRDEVAGAALGRRPPVRLGAGRWEPFVLGVVSGNGRDAAGVPAAPGAGAGRLRRLTGAPSGWRIAPREVLAIAEPVPQVAALLWNAAGVVTSGGSVGAHLFEVARSLGVPAVVGADLAADDGCLAAVDGDAGVVWVLETSGVAASGLGA
jgi:phosphohistidine swiveling domain-containing protein